MATFIAGASGEAAELRLPRVIADQMVLQRDTENPIWGWAEPGEDITVSFAGSTVTTKTETDGRWRVNLPEFAANSAAQILRVESSGGTQIQLSDVLVGEVWFFCGPSNIYWPVERCANAKAEIAAADFPEIRFFSMPQRLADEPQENCEGEWTVCSPETVGSASGVAYFFSRQLHRDLDMPVAVLQSFWGGTRVEGWTSAEAVEANPALEPVVDWWKKAAAEYDIDAERQKHQLAKEHWEKAAAVAKHEGKEPLPEPRMPVNPAKSIHHPGRLFNGMIAPLIPYGIRGAASYQGLGNLFWAEYGDPLMTTMFRDWRERWGRGDFPIGMIQPAPFPTDGWEKQSPDAYSLQRETQIHLLKQLPGMGLAPTMDIINFKNVHYPNKQIVGHRLAQWALADVYDRDVAHGGPIYQSMEVEGRAIRIHFQNVTGGLKTSDNEPVSGFTIAGKDGIFLPARSAIDGNTVMVRNEKVPNPIAVHFAWGDTETSNLIDGEGLPASLFRTEGKREVQTHH